MEKDIIQFINGKEAFPFLYETLARQRLNVCTCGQFVKVEDYPWHQIMIHQDPLLRFTIIK